MTSTHKITVVWLLLVSATLLSWRVGADHPAGGSQIWPALTVLVVACIKIRLVGLWFMELRDAATPLRLAFEAYVVTLCAAMIGFYVSGS